MLKLPVIFTLLLLMQTAEISITSPHARDILRGQVEITGNMNVPDFASAELAFSYDIAEGNASNSPATWFTIQTFSQPVRNDALAIWDTTLLTDGDYIMRLRVFLQDGTSQDILVSDLKIRNDEPPATDVPTPTESSELITATPLPTLTVQPAIATRSFPSLTPLPANPASVTSSSIYSNFARGGLIAFVLFIVVFLLLRLRKN